ncbi:hypothetical protein E2C01_029203 [Portunus trituberculatus]|uniref:Uncharacterized protein n=1 Tax=Portunus trituberculatus TaxID=210409 RepID=A0A5B7ER65_PORTR|nr:hypothetical protein [Portunus trituberculatus]
MEEDAVRVEEDFAGGGFLGWVLVVRREGLAVSRGSLEAFVLRGGRVPAAGGLALEGRGRRLGGVCASLLEPERDDAVV